MNAKWQTATERALMGLYQKMEQLEDKRKETKHKVDQIAETDDKIATMESMHDSLLEYLTHLQVNHFDWLLHFLADSSACCFVESMFIASIKLQLQYRRIFSETKKALLLP